ncbi:MAG: hypothetical protein IH946_05930 [Bacteroidetes bacterium]|nr:hypothetical protein [Bacteroidota bacterium]
MARDFNGDGNTDLLIAGNFYVSEVETGRADAGTGLLLLGDGSGKFSVLNYIESGFKADKDVRNLAVIKGADGQDIILVANNNDRLQLIKHIGTADKLLSN